MKTFKKLFSVSAIVALLGTLAPMYAFGATYSEEEQEAYAYAHSKQITTMPTIDQANMNGNLKRIEMAKMIANYAINVLGLEPDTSKTCTFTDITAALDAEYDNGVTKACQLGLMGQNITAFRPNDPVTRGEFGTTLSRALNANDADKLAEMNKANPFYEAHLNYLKQEGIMTNISNPNMNERRGWVMIMMMRADEDYTAASEGCSMTELLACFGSDDINACMAACNGEEESAEEEVLPGYATVSTKAAADQTVALNAVDKKIGTVTLKAGENDTTVTALEITKAGLGAAADVFTISLMRNGEYVTNSATLTNKVAKLRFRPNLVLKAGKSETFDVVVSMAGSGKATAGGQHEFSVTAVTVSNGTFGGTPAKLGSLTTSNYEIASITNATVSSEDVDAGDSDVELATISFKTPVDATINSITLTSENNVDDLNDVLKNVKAYVDDVVIGTTTVNAETITINGLNKSLKKSKTLDITLKGDIVVADTTALVLNLEKNHINAVEDSTNERMSSNSTSGTLNIGNGAGLTLKNNVKKAKTVAQNTEDVVLFDADITATSNVEILDYTLTFTNYKEADSGALEDIRVSVNGDEYELKTIVFSGTDDGTINLADKYLNAFTIDANKTANIQVLATTHSGSSAYSVTLTINKLKNTDTNKIITPAKKPSIKGHSTSVGTATIDITKASVAGSTIKIGEETTVLSLDVEAKAEDVTVQSVVLQVTVDGGNTGALASVKELSFGGKALELADAMATCADNSTGSYSACEGTGIKQLDFTFKTLGTIKADETKNYNVTLTIDDDVESDVLGVKYTVGLPANGFTVKGSTSDLVASLGSAENSKGHQLVTERPTILVSQNAEYVTVKITNDSDYAVKLTGFQLKLTSAKNKDGYALLPAIQSIDVLEDTKNGEVITSKFVAISTGLGNTDFIFSGGEEPIINKGGKSVTYVVRLNSTTDIETTDYTAVERKMWFIYGTSTKLIEETYGD